MKHIELRMLALQDWRTEGRLDVRKIQTERNGADLLTKPMTIAKLVKFGRLLGLRGAHFDNSQHDASS